jgi:hypothetical protein
VHHDSEKPNQYTKANTLNPAGRTGEALIQEQKNPGQQKTIDEVNE